jgi:hypothetical protein
MNNDASLSSPARPSAINNETVPDVNEPAHDASIQIQNDPECDECRRVRKARRAGLTKKLQFMTHLLRNLDSLVFAELGALYYME